MGFRNTKTDEATAYNKAGDDAAKQGRTDSAELFYGMAVDAQKEADQARRGGRGGARRG